MIITRVHANLSAWTFTIKPVRELLDRYVGDGVGWADPFAGKSDLAQYRNDHNPERGQPSCMEAAAFAATLPYGLKGSLFDPPWSYRQVSEHYQVIGKKATQLDTSYNFYRRAQEPLAHRIAMGGLAICCGYNSNGFGKKFGFEIIEILLMAHGMNHNDSIVTVERKIAATPYESFLD